MNSFISVIIPVYKNINLLNDSLKSLLDQTYKFFEVIVVNDGSSEKKKIFEIIKKFKKKKLDIKFINLKKNRGVSCALNKGINKSKGKYISWLSHDDFFHPKKFEKQINFMKKKKIDVCFTNFYLVNNQKKILKKINYKNIFFESKEHILIRDNINFCTAIINKKIYKKIGCFDLQKKHTQDYDLLIKIFRSYKIYFINDYLFYSRVHKKQSSIIGKEEANKEKEKLFLENFIYIKKIYFNSNFLQKFYIVFFLRIRNLNLINIKLEQFIKNHNIFFTLILKTIFKASELYLSIKNN